MKNFIATLFLGAVIGFGCAKTIDQSAVAEPKGSLADVIKPGMRIGMAYLNVEEGVDLEAFEHFLSTDYLRKWGNAYRMADPNIQSLLLKVIGGPNTGKYGWMAVFPDNQSHARLFTESGQTEILSKALEEAGVQSIEPVFPGYVDWNHLGDVQILASY